MAELEREEANGVVCVLDPEYDAVTFETIIRAKQNGSRVRRVRSRQILQGS